MSKTIGLVAGTVVAAIIVLSSGCASYYGVQRHDAQVAKVIQVAAIDGGKGALVGVDLLGLSQGYTASWSDNPWDMTWRTLLDAGTVALASYGAYEVSKGGGGSSNSGESTTTAGGHSVTVSGQNNTVIVGDRTTTGAGSP